MSRSPLELDFFGMEQKENSSSSSKPQFHKVIEQRRTFRGMKSAISKINPQLLKTVISSGVAAGTNLERKSSENCDFLNQETVFVPSNGVLVTPENLFPVSSLPVFNPGYSSESTPATTTAPLTIFYNGTVSVFDVPSDKAEIIMKLAENGSTTKSIESTESKHAMYSSSIVEQKLFLERLNGDDLPIARKKSLQRFFEKRKERMTCVSPYA